MPGTDAAAGVAGPVKTLAVPAITATAHKPASTADRRATLPMN